MPSALAGQLAQIASLDAERLTSRTGVPSSKSYLFPANVASEQDLDAVHALGQSGFDELVQLDPEMDEFEDELFSEGAKRTDRLMLSAEDNAALDKTLERCLRRLSKWIGIMAGGKCIEWLVRRFRVHEMNAEAFLQAFLPYHDSQNFARMLAILKLPTTSPYHAPFAALVKKAQPVPREYITNAVSSARDPSLRLLSNLVWSVKTAIDEDAVHRALLAFWSATLVDLLQRARVSAGGRIPEGTVKLLVEVFVTLLSTPKAGPEVSAAVYPPLVLLTRSVHLADAPFSAVVDAILTPATGADPSQRVLTLLVILDQRKNFPGLGEDAAAHLVKIPQLAPLLIAAVEKYGFETAMQAVVAALCHDLSVSKDTLTTLIDRQGMPPSVVQAAVPKLLAAPASDRDAARALLSVLKQRHPQLVDAAVLANDAVDTSLVQWSSAETAFVDVHSAEVASRVSGVREMYTVAETAGLTPQNAAELIKSSEDLQSAQLAITARLRDTDIAVLEAVYAQPELLLALLHGLNYVDIVTPTFTAAKVEPSALGLHLAFIGNSYLAAHPDSSSPVFQHLLLPNLLATEERRAFGPQQWPAVVKSCRLLDRVKGDVALDAAPGQLVAYNQDLIKSLALAIASSGDIGARVDVLVSSLSSPLRNARLLAALTLAQLVAGAGGYQHVVAARSLAALETVLAGQALRDVDEVESSLSDNVIKAVVSKPAAPKTQQRVFLSLLTSAVAIPPSPNTATVWLGDVDASSAEGQARTVLYALYRWANSSNLAVSVAKHLLHAVFGQLGENVLVFLAGVWASNAESDLRVAALRHAAAFVQACTAAKPADFQLVIPATLIALQDPARPVREAAAALLRAISVTPHTSNTDIYALETIYGSRSDLVQLLKPSDLTKYLETLVRALDDMVIDADRLALVQGQSLDLQSKNGRKDTMHRRDVVDWLMSHVLAWRADMPRRSLLSSLDRAVNISRLQGSLPLLTPLVDSSKDEAAWLASLPARHRAEYLELVFSPFNARNKAAVTDAQGDVWEFLLALVDKNSPIGLELQALALERMVDGLFAALLPAQKVEYIVKVIQSLHELPTTNKFATREAVSKLPLSPVEVANTIEALLEPLESSQQRKKAKHTDDADKAAQAFADLTMFIVSRDWKKLPGDAPLVAVLMGVLSTVLTKRQSIKEGVDYLEQEVLGATLAQLEQIQDPADILRARVGIEVIVKVIRASTNPRTSQRALLVASELARLIPEAVLHNVMPIFTFMGSSDLQRDDPYSFGVVEKTVERIVPVMTASLRDKTSSKLELYNEAHAFLCIFTDMANRLPKHRTLPFFVHLVKSLGADDFLAPVCMLLATRGKVDALELPLALAAAFPVAARTETMLEVVREASRVVSSDDESSDGFLPEGENTASTLLLLVAGLAKGLLGKACPQSTLETVVRELIALTPDMDDDDADSEHLENALANAMRLLSAESFLEITAQILQSDSEEDVNRALELFSQRLPLVKPDLRAKAKSMPTIVSRAAGLLNGPSGQNALAALERVVATAVPSEDSALAGIMPTVIKSAKDADAEGAAGILTLLSAMVRRLASRTIPFIQTVLDACLGLIRSSTPLTAAAAFGALSALVETVPTFIGAKQLVALLGAAADYRGADEAASATLISAAAKRVPTKTLVPVVMDLWKSLKGGTQAPTEAFFALLRHALKNADRKALPGLTKPLFAFFLDVFDLRFRDAAKLAPETVDRVETSAINSFLELVTKLSDASFKPLFVRLYDWAVVDLGAGVADPHVIARRTVLLRVMDGLLDRFKHLLTPYMGTLLPLVDELLNAYAAGEIADAALWTLLHGVLAKSLDVDDGAFWTDAAMLKLLPGLVAQLSLTNTDLATLAASPESPPAHTLAALAASTGSENTLKKVNNAVCLATRAEEPKARMAALRALDAMWERHADELIQFVPETVAEFLAELLEDENAEVEALARKVLARIEGVTGSLKEYLE